MNSTTKILPILKINLFKPILLILIMAMLLFSCSNGTVKKPEKIITSQVEDTLEMLDLQIAKDSLNPELWKMQYQLLILRKDTMAALRSLRHYNYLAPEDGDGWLEMAWLLANSKNPGALIITDSLLRVKDDMIKTRARYIRGIYFSNINQDDQAIREFDSTIIHNYTFIDAYIEKGIILHDQKKYAEALKTFQQAFKIVNNNPELYYWIGKSYEGLGNKVEAADWQKKYDALKK
jgi:tetratricopeptide (TPR) repeat protein